MTTAAPTPAPALRWVNADAEPTDAFLDALVAMLWDVCEKRTAGDADQAGDDHQGGTER